MPEILADLGLVLRPLSRSDAAVYYQVVQAGRTHLTRHGNYQEEADATEHDIAEAFTTQGYRSKSQLRTAGV